MRTFVLFPWSMALAAACAASLAACKTRQFNKPAGSSAKSGADLKAKTLARTSDLPPEEDLQEQNDLVRLTDGSLSQDFRADFAMCSDYPFPGCDLSALKAGPMPILYGKQKELSALLASGSLPDAQKAAVEAGLQEVERQIAAFKGPVEANAKAYEAVITDPDDVRNPVKYVAYLKSVGREPKRFAAATVLKYMRVLRKNAYVFPDSSDLSPKGLERRKRFYEFLSMKVVPPNPGETDPKKAKDAEQKQAIEDYNWYMKIREKASGANDAVLHDQDWIPDVGDDLYNGNLGAAPPHWSDLQAHYYAVTGHRRHGCFTSVHRAIAGIREESKLPELIQGEGPAKFSTMRDTVVRWCLSQNKTATGKGRILYDWAEDEAKILPIAKNLIDNPPPDFSSYDLELALGTRAAFRRMWLSQVVGAKPGEESLKGKLNPKTKRPWNIFDYVMIAPVWAKNFDQQQSVLNAFYNDLANEYGEDGWPLATPSTSPVEPYVPGTAMGCNIRPARLLVDEDKSKVCAFDVPRKSTLHGIGR